MLYLAQESLKHFSPSKPHWREKQLTGKQEAILENTVEKEKHKAAEFQPHWGGQDGKAVKESKVKKNT